MTSESLKVNFMISKEAKQNIERYRKSRRLTNSSLIDKLLQFDSEALQLFISIFKEQQEQENQGLEYLQFNNIEGGIVFTNSMMNNAIHSNLSSLSNTRRKEEKIFSADTVENMSKRELGENLEIMEKAILVIGKSGNDTKDDIKELKLRIEKLEKMITR
ncbi:hypothetical protein [Sulfurospirillum barnesii]|uniref:Uncharacterized protein n=1 Tax=Sulfurospirillum barnesii (strain ATCC 700032 / DSM 10660 / SES-3) TaxID=760154 RepID=I3Y084_SULBS|nr:hypothetical protein [Sulfurospirillum barnesii]AFL69608.1 hypothetical protein Sulba_2338 [Sulfurospirillum barnesii SES-3]